ncbi:LIS1 homology motif [Dillenia turbinata]|uniref:LIS1 homology motif n=1 Tax=Dillenia turbinata TaxID=194707 RepID=A0AAN8ZIS3_9MAGN
MDVESVLFRCRLERYIYDYLMKKNCHQTAEIFKQEAGVEIDEKSPPAIDVLDGFLHEWWLTFYDMYCARHRNLHQLTDKPSILAEDEQVINTHGDIFPGKHSMNAQYTWHQGDNSGSGLTAENIIPLSALGWAPSDVKRENEGCLSSESQKELLACGTESLKPLRSLADLLPQDIGSSAEEVLKMASMPSAEGIDTLSPGFEDQMLQMLCAMEQSQLELKDTILSKSIVDLLAFEKFSWTTLGSRSLTKEHLGECNELSISKCSATLIGQSINKRKSPLSSEVGSNNIQGATPFPVETSFSACKVSDDIKSMSPADDNDDGASASMCNLQTAIAEVGGSKVKETNSHSSTDGLASGFADSLSVKGVSSASDDPIYEVSNDDIKSTFITDDNDDGASTSIYSLQIANLEAVCEVSNDYIKSTSVADDNDDGASPSISTLQISHFVVARGGKLHGILFFITHHLNDSTGYSMQFDIIHMPLLILSVIMVNPLILASIPKAHKQFSS